MPAPPEFRGAFRKEWALEIFIQGDAHCFSRPDYNVHAAGEIRIQFHGTQADSQKDFKSGKFPG